MINYAKKGESVLDYKEYGEECKLKGWSKTKCLDRAFIHLIYDYCSLCPKWTVFLNKWKKISETIEKIYK